MTSALSRFRLQIVLFLSALILAGCIGGNTNSTDKQLISNRARVIQTSTNIQSVLPYIYDPLEFSMKLTADGRPFCDHPLAPPYCIDEDSQPISHNDLLAFSQVYSEFVTIDNGLFSADATLSDMTVTVSGDTGKTIQTYVVRQYELFGDSRLYNISGKYETTWTKVNGEWKLFKIYITMDLSQA